ncbi:uracil phosphoribosyltransferase [Pelagicoccus sp. NFK12]|uniref:Uracil phosphoribosyltransferase n=1 Tax=Pelagicoccus enzymogenes TaxID=2773457 RepID=A0A927IGV5_9BACT|nr:uracil phosphoribosyltransferase [Pelagicoccus enzymogenes]MBD5779204.1 uracil phosphoribosyltransferase [Pelagicoccus enzymogenes]MDQ8198444.1 uracil phosphoribosyltransferase [Pelagicoccus enzymogenes]
MKRFPTLTVSNHPLIQHKLSYIRDKRTSKKVFKELVDEVGTLLAYEITKNLPVRAVRVETPLETTTCNVIDSENVVLVPLLRAGLGMVDGVRNLIPNCAICHLGLYRDHETHEPVTYYFKPMQRPENRMFIMVDPMLATGGSAIASADMLKQSGAKDIKFMCLVAAPEGVEAFQHAHPDIEIFAAALDDRLNDDAYILPGLGDAGDRLFGTT